MIYDNEAGEINLGWNDWRRLFFFFFPVNRVGQEMIQGQIVKELTPHKRVTAWTDLSLRVKSSEVSGKEGSQNVK